jgi:hypothetical protein
MSVLPSNYISQVRGPFYTLQFQTAAKLLAQIQIEAQDVFADNDYDFTRPQFLWQTLGTLVFPAYRQEGLPDISSDNEYRHFLRSMLVLLLKGSKPETLKQGMALLTDANLILIEKAIAARAVDNADYGVEDQFAFEMSLEEIHYTNTVQEHSHGIRVDHRGNGKTTEFIGEEDQHVHDILNFVVQPHSDGHTHEIISEFPKDPLRLQHNASLVIRALTPAHTVYTYRHLFREAFGTLFEDSMSFNMEKYEYEDFRKFFSGVKEVTGSGDTLQDRRLFSDPSRSFRHIKPNAELEILTGPNLGTYRVQEVLHFPVDQDLVPRLYSTSGGLTGFLRVLGDRVIDPDQDFSTVIEGDTLQIAEGPNAGTYRISYLLGSDGGPVGFTTGFANSVRIEPSLLRLDNRMSSKTQEQAYRVSVDRMGAKVPQNVEGENAAELFYL